MKIRLTLIALLISQYLFAQKSGLTTIKIAVLSTSEQIITPVVQTQLENKLKNVLSENGISEGFATQFLLTPQFSINERTVVEGMQKMTVIKFDMNLQVKNWLSKQVFSSRSIVITGSGSSDSEALRNAVSKIKPSDERIKSFLEDSSIKIQTYYQKECDNLLLDADNQANIKNYAAALAILSGIPQGVSCYKVAGSKKDLYYQKYQQQRCNQYLKQAKTQLAENNYKSALYYLGQIDREASCAKEADALLLQIGKEVDAENKKEWEMLMKREENDAKNLKIRTDILEKILENYFQQKIIVTEG